MASRYQFSEGEIREIEQARKGNKNKRVEARLKALELRAKGAKAKEVSEATGFHAGSFTRLVAKYRDHGIDAITGNHMAAIAVSGTISWALLTYHDNHAQF